MQLFLGSMDADLISSIHGFISLNQNGNDYEKKVWKNRWCNAVRSKRMTL
jgi:hypothetical protein